MRRSLLCGTLVGAVVLGTAGVGAAAPPPAGPYAAAVSQPRVDPYYPAKGDPSVDALHYGLKIRWAPTSRTLTGRAIIAFRVPSDEQQVVLDLSKALGVDRVRLDGRKVAFSHPGNDLVINAGAVLAKGSHHKLRVRYSGSPRPTAAPTDRTDIPHLGWTVTKGGEVWTMQEPFGAFTWFPVNDQPADKAFYDVSISAPHGMVGVFNGRLESRRSTGTRTITRWHLASPASSYLTTIAIGDYVRHRDTGPHGLPISYWLPRGDTAAHRSLLAELRRTPKMIRWLEARLGRYPFDRIGVVVVPSTSAMETQTLVTMGGRLLSEFGHRTFRSDLLHEYAHQWYGDTVTPTSWPDLWLNESFAMYTQIRWQVDRGWQTMAAWRTALAAQDDELRASDGPPGAYHRKEFGDLCVYYCGALMLDRLRTRLGAAAFAGLWRDWPQEHRFGSADRSTYVAWASARTGQDLAPFFTTWLTSPTTPPG